MTGLELVAFALGTAQDFALVGARTPYPYINDAASVIPAAEFESEVDLVIEMVLQRLQDCQVVDSNVSSKPC